MKNADKRTVLVTNANEILTSNGIHGKVASVGVGFGTGRHTAAIRYRKRTRSAKTGQSSSRSPSPTSRRIFEKKKVSPYVAPKSLKRLNFEDS